MIVKHKLGLSDQETIDIIREGGKGPSQIGHRSRFPAWYNPIIPYI